MPEQDIPYGYRMIIKAPDGRVLRLIQPLRSDDVDGRITRKQARAIKVWMRDAQRIYN